MATSGLSCSSELGPRPWVTPGAVLKGLAGPTISPKKNAETT